MDPVDGGVARGLDVVPEGARVGGDLLGHPSFSTMVSQIAPLPLWLTTSLTRAKLRALGREQMQGSERRDKRDMATSHLH